jgi:hypothetical protein
MLVVPGALLVMTPATVALDALSASTVWLYPLRSSVPAAAAVAPPLTESLEVVARALSTPSFRVPAVTVVLPVYVFAAVRSSVPVPDLARLVMPAPVPVALAMVAWMVSVPVVVVMVSVPVPP